MTVARKSPGGTKSLTPGRKKVPAARNAAKALGRSEATRAVRTARAGTPKASVAVHERSGRLRVSLSPWERERQGVLPEDVLAVASRLGWPEGILLKAIGLPQSSWSRKKIQNGAVDGAPGIAVLALQGLLAEALSVAKATVDAEVLKTFDVDKWLGRWLQTPMPALAGQAPAELLDVPAGQAVVMQLLGSLESGTYQ